LQPKCSIIWLLFELFKRLWQKHGGRHPQVSRMPRKEK